ncbi:MAG: Xaa-Pro peptidase family protein [Chloroflexi bacterium]|nr:Xaa-Pro peptidase family protein [Chloroflexota bacterium]MBU1749786.1 Xaa-Pro peptidase family protein [Chloroflexota bacterium]MBU1880324.1 Xaa-Pro peptidase family protein [Chloroflexota bacterium]
MKHLVEKRLAQVQRALSDHDLDYMFLSISPDLFYLTGYSSFVSERLHLLVIPPEGRPTLVFPDFEKGIVEHLADWIDVVGWLETEDPVAFVRATLASGDRDRPIRVAISDHTRAVFLLRLQAALPQARFSLASEVLAPMRRVKDEVELRLLKEAQGRAVQALQQLVELPFAGRTEQRVAADLRRFCADRGLEEGFGVQLGAGANGAQAHLPPSDRVIQRGEPVMIDFWAAYEGYYCDCSRTLHVGPPPPEFQEIYAIMREANHAALAAVRPGASCQSIDRAARQVIDEAGYGEHFFHRLGHGIGIEIHEEPYLVEGNEMHLEPGMTFTNEPGIYLPGRFGCRIEDVVAVTATGGVSLTDYTHDIVEVE